MSKLTAGLLAVLLLCGLAYCTREDGLPDPPPRQLVPCDPDAGTEDPLACPAPSDDAAASPDAADGGTDA